MSFQGGERLDFSGQIYCRLQGLQCWWQLDRSKRQLWFGALAIWSTPGQWCLRVFRTFQSYMFHVGRYSIHGAYGNHTPFREGFNSAICIDLFMDLWIYLPSSIQYICHISYRYKYIYIHLYMYIYVYILYTIYYTIRFILYYFTIWQMFGTFSNNLFFTRVSILNRTWAIAIHILGLFPTLKCIDCH